MRKLFFLFAAWSLSALILGCSKKVVETVATEEKPKTVATAPSVENKSEQQKKINYDKQVQLKEASYDQLKEAQLQSKSPISSGYKEYYQSGTEKHNAGDFSGAIADFSKAIEMNPQYGDAFGFRGLSKYKSGDKTGACTDWEKAGQLGYSRSAAMIDSYCR